MTVPFACTMCGRCCRGLRLPLSLTEALAWLERAGEIDLVCEAIPWPADLPDMHPAALYKRERSFLAISGELPVRVIISLMATFSGPCPNLGADNRCTIYEARPNACRIYPAEANPFIALEPAQKLCPPEAWGAWPTEGEEEHELVSAGVREAIQRLRGAAVDEVDQKRQLAAGLGIHTAALANEGLVMHRPERGALRVALQEVISGRASASDNASWFLVTDRPPTLAALYDCAALATTSVEGPGWRYHSFASAMSATATNSGSDRGSAEKSR